MDDLPDSKTGNDNPTFLTDPVMFDRIDKLFACNGGDYINLPQIVVVGDQSSRKSSVLQGLINLLFSRDSGLCTRFATQITFRRHMVSRIVVSIIAAKGSSTEHTERVRAWTKEIGVLDEKAFAKILVEVHSVMGTSNDKPPHPKTFSKDVFCLEVCGPEQEHLSVVEVPGIFKRTTQGVTSKPNIQIVRSMVHGYMKHPRSVMYTVVPANFDIATQEILEIAEELDPKGQRTLGVLTKPDSVDKGIESAVVDVVKGKKH